MNRRGLRSTVATWFSHPPAPATPVPALPAEGLAGHAFAGAVGQATYLTVIVRRSGSTLAAERVRLALLAQAGDVDRANVRATPVTGRRLPAELAQGPGASSLVSWETVAGAATLRTRWVAGYFRRGELTWEIIAAGAGADANALAGLVTSLATDLTTRQPSASCGEWTGGLWSLLPGEADLPGSLGLETVFDGDRIYDVAVAAA